MTLNLPGGAEDHGPVSCAPSDVTVLKSERRKLNKVVQLRTAATAYTKGCVSLCVCVWGVASQQLQEHHTAV